MGPETSLLGYCINLLDTPGHKDFSEDTYRTLAAADNAVMLVDGAKGLEPQTRKLFEVCRLRSLPIFTFINKMDRPTREPLELLDEIEKELGITPYVMNWAIGTGDQFKGVYDRASKTVHLFKRSAHGQREAEVNIYPFDDPQAIKFIGQNLYNQLLEDLEVLDSVGAEWNTQDLHRGKLTPIFFGSAMTNFGVELFLKSFLECGLTPTVHDSSSGEVSPTDEDFSAFVFKLQANMDPRHRDRIAFVRVCSDCLEE